MVAFSFNGKWLPEDMTDKERKAEVFRLILSGEKKSTIRKAKFAFHDYVQDIDIYKNPRAPDGSALQLYWKQRTKDCEKIKEIICGEPIFLLIDSDGETVEASYDYGEEWAISEEQLKQISKNDGFKSLTDFARFFVGHDSYYLYPFGDYDPFEVKRE